MCGTSSPILLVRIVAALMLATIGVHAATPASQPLERGHGSAFSAATYNVSLKSDRATAAIERPAIVPVGDGVAPVAAPTTALMDDAIGPDIRYRAQAPPPPPRPTHPSPRGPPTAPR